MCGQSILKWHCLDRSHFSSKFKETFQFYLYSTIFWVRFQCFQIFKAAKVQNCHHTAQMRHRYLCCQKILPSNTEVSNRKTLKHSINHFNTTHEILPFDYGGIKWMIFGHIFKQQCIFVGSSCAVYRERCRILTAVYKMFKTSELL